MFKVLLACASSISLMTLQSARAADLGPGDPDVVMECEYDKKPAEICTFSCGTELAQGGGKETVVWGGVSRAEIYNRGTAGRIDTRSWIFVRFKTGPKANVVGLYAGPNVHCHTTAGSDELTGVMKITKFRF